MVYLGFAETSVEPLAWPWRSLRKSSEGLGFRLFVDILDESLGAAGCDFRCIPGSKKGFRVFSGCSPGHRV